MNELPQLASSSYVSTATPMGLFLGPNGGGGGAEQAQNALAAWYSAATSAQSSKVETNQPEKPMTARIVRVCIADPNEDLPIEKRLLHSGEEKLTDLTDQELFFEIQIAAMLTKHNETRTATRDKKQSEKFGRDIYLEPARIRDLKMVVVTIATF